MNRSRSVTVVLSTLFLMGATSQVSAQDADSDGINDDSDNCLLVANPDQIDTDADGFGNRCDADYNNDLIVNFLDLARLGDSFLTNDPDVDSNNDGVVNFLDLILLSSQFLGPPGPGATPPTGFTQRPLRIEYDYDNNGVIDGTTEFSYDDQGRVSTLAIVETPDGTADLIRIQREDSVTTFIFDADGNYDTFTQDFADPASFDFTLEFEFDDDNTLLRVDQITAFGASYSDFIYAGGLPVRSDGFLTADNTFLGSIVYTYDMNGRFDTSVQESLFGNLALLDFDWNAQGQVTRRVTRPGEPDEEIIDFERVNGVLERRVITNSALTSPPQSYVETFVFDPVDGRLNEVLLDEGDDGTIEASLEVIWENGPCQLLPNVIVTLAPVGTAGLDGDPTSSIGESNLCGF